MAATPLHQQPGAPYEQAIEQFCDKLHARLIGIEEQLSKTGNPPNTTTLDAPTDLSDDLAAARAKLAELKYQTVARIETIREQLKKSEHSVEFNVEAHLQELKADLDQQLVHLQNSAADVVTDITGGVLF